jgi:hypothetical protein
MMRAVLTGIIARTRDPLGEVDRFKREFQGAPELIDMAGADQARTERLRRSLMGIFDAVCGRP